MIKEHKADIVQSEKTGQSFSGFVFDAPICSQSQSPPHSSPLRLRGKRVAMVVYSQYPAEPRTRRTVDALLEEGMSIDLVCLGKTDPSTRATVDGLELIRCSLVHRRDSKLAYLYNYSAFTAFCALVLAVRSLKRSYDLVYIHNMPDILVLSALIPKLLGSAVVFDIHDPMPELMATIFNLDKGSLFVRLIRRIEKCSIGWAHLVVTTNIAFKDAFASRSCAPEKIGIVMNSPDERIFPFRGPLSSASENGVPGKRFVIMYHGTLTERNGLDLAIDALALVIKSIPAAELRIFGRETPFLRKVMESARKQGLESRVHYFGPKSLECLVANIEDCDVGIISNQRNAFTEINMPTRIFEYLTMGKPAIAPRTTGIRDYFPLDSLIYFEPGNAEDLARKIEEVAFHYSDALEIVERGQKIYLAHTWSQEKCALINLVDQVLDKGRDTSMSEGQSQNRYDGYKYWSPINKLMRSLRDLNSLKSPASVNLWGTPAAGKNLI